MAVEIIDNDSAKNICIFSIAEYTPLKYFVRFQPCIYFNLPDYRQIRQSIFHEG